MNELLRFLEFDLLISIPEAWTGIWLTFALLGLNPRLYGRQIMLLAVINSVYTDMLLGVLSFPVHVVNSLLSALLLLFVLFRSFKASTKLSIFITINVVVAITDMAANLLTNELFGRLDREQIIQAVNYKFLACMYFVLAVEWILAWKLVPRIAEAVIHFKSRLVRSKREGLLPLIFMQLFVFFMVTLTVLFDYTAFNEHVRVERWVKYFAAALLLYTIFGFVRVTGRTRENTAKDTQQVYIEQISAMFTSIRGQRHDFLNHVQVMYTMLKMGKHAELQTYMGDVVKETHDVRDVVHHASPALAALVKAKTAIALSRNIAFTSELSDRWDDTSAVKMIDIVKIVGNLVNNAFEEVEKLPAELREVHAVIRLDKGIVELSVANKGPALSEQERLRIFEPGYTTKKDGQHDGLGLSIVRDRVKHYNGSLTLESDERAGTVFRILLPGKGQSA